MLNSFSRIGEARPKQEWSNLTEFCGMLGLKFRKMSVPFAPPPGISRMFGRIESALDLEFLPTGFALSPWIFEAWAMLSNQQLFAITHCLLAWFSVIRSVAGLPAEVEIKKQGFCGKIPLIFFSQFQLSFKSKFVIIIWLFNKVFLLAIL